jgi:hypothetical protein
MHGKVFKPHTRGGAFALAAERIARTESVEKRILRSYRESIQERLLNVGTGCMGSIDEMIVW